MTSQDPYLHGRSDFQQHRQRNYEGMEQRDQYRYDYGYDSAREDHEREELHARRQQERREEQQRAEEEEQAYYAQRAVDDAQAEEAYGKYMADQAQAEAFEQQGPGGEVEELPF